MPTLLRIAKLDHAKDIKLPEYGTEQSAGMDLHAAVCGKVIINPNEIAAIPTGISISLPKGLEGQIRPRSGLAIKFGITVLNSPGTIDPDYRGEIKVILINHGTSSFIVERGMRIAQIVIAKYESIILKESQCLGKTLRGTKGLGSTGY